MHIKKIWFPAVIAIDLDRRWEETMQHYKKTAKGKSKSTQLQRMVETMPEVARVYLLFL